MRRLFSILLIVMTAACGQTSSQVSATSEASASDWSIYATTMVSPGTPLAVSISSEFSERQDILVDLLDSSGWYVGNRVTVEAGQQWNQVTLALPATVKDPKSVYLAVKVLPVGASWEKYRDQKLQPLQWPVATPIARRLYFGGKLSAWNYPFISRVGNHGSSTVEVGLGRTGPFQGAYAIQSSAETYGIFKTEFGLNLETGAVYRSNIDASHSPTSTITKRLNPPQNQAEMTAYIELLNGLIQAVRYNAGSQQGIQWVQLKEAEAYLSQASGSLFARFGETLRLTYESPERLRLFNNTSNPIGLSYGAAAPRDMLVDLLVEGRWVAGLRLPIQAGSNSVTPELKFPDSIPPLTPAWLSIKIVQAGGPWTSKTAELNIPVTILGPNHIEWVSVATIDKIQANGDVSVSGFYSGTGPLDVRFDLLDAKGQWLTGAQVTGKLAYEGSNSYSFDLSFKAPGNLRPGDQVTLYTKLLPLGGSWKQAIDEHAIGLTVE